MDIEGKCYVDKNTVEEKHLHRINNMIIESKCAKMLESLKELEDQVDKLRERNTQTRLQFQEGLKSPRHVSFGYKRPPAS